jgi:hypothetical protein
MARETLTAEERQVLEDCYRCRCSGCTGRRELIAKALRIINDLSGRLAGPRCECCSNLCVDLAKDEQGLCPSCSSIAEPIAEVKP